MSSLQTILIELVRRTVHRVATRMKSAEALFVCCAMLVAGMVCYAAAIRNGSETAPAIASTFGPPFASHHGANPLPGRSRVAVAQLTRRGAEGAAVHPKRVPSLGSPAHRDMQTGAPDSPPRDAAPSGPRAGRTGSQHEGTSRTRIGDLQRAGLISHGTPHLDLRPAGAVSDQPPNPSPTDTRTPSPTATATPTASATPVPVLPTDTPVPVDAGTNATVWITGYTLTGTTATGGQAGPGVCAVDPSYIPLGTQISIYGVGSCVAEDTGPGVVGAHIDVWVPSYDIALGITGWHEAHW